MKRNSQFIISASAASVLAFSTLAQDPPYQDSSYPKPNPPDSIRDTTPNTRRTDRLNGAAKASDIIGMSVRNYQDEKLGKVEDVAVDLESGRILQVILSTRGFLGVGDTLTAVPPGALHHDVVRKVLHLTADKEKLQGSPKFDMSKWADSSDSNHLAEVYRYYDQQPAFAFIQSADSIADQSFPESQRATKDQRTLTERNLAVGKRYDDKAPNIVSNHVADATWSQNRALLDRQSMIPVSRLSDTQKTSKLLGMSVKNERDEKLGKVDNVLLDLASGRIVAVILSSGGFLGINDELSAVPAAALRYNTKWDTLHLDVTKEMLSSAPHFKADQWPNFEQPSYAGGFYRAYRIEPYFIVDPTADARSESRLDWRTNSDNTARFVRDRDERNTATPTADNTERNVRDRNDRTLTPLDQGNSKSDVATTAQIRKEIIAAKEMSVNARNVKIITKEGRVTLRGPVNTAEEKRLIGDIADRAARSENVDNQLEVKTTPVNNN